MKKIIDSDGDSTHFAIEKVGGSVLTFWE